MPLAYEGDTVKIGASVGISLYPDNGENIEEIMQAADAAMYQVKRSGKNNYKFADSSAS